MVHAFMHYMQGLHNLALLNNVCCIRVQLKPCSDTEPSGSCFLAQSEVEQIGLTNACREQSRSAVKIA